MAESETVFLQHPHTGHTVEVKPNAESLTPWMVKGYQQIPAPAAPAKGE